MAALRSVMGGMAVALLAISLQVGPAAAHSPLISSSPADGDVLAAAPQAIKMKFRGTARLIRLALTGAQSGEVTLSEEHLMVEKTVTQSRFPPSRLMNTKSAGAR